MVFGLSDIYTERGLTQRLTMLLIEYVFTHSGPEGAALKRPLLADCSPSRQAVIDPKGTPEQVIYQLCVWRCVLLNLPLPFWDITR